MSRVIGVDVGGTNTKLALLDERGKVLERSSFKTDGDQGPTAYVESLAVELEPWLGAEQKVLAVGIAMAGLVSPDGTIKAAPNLPDYQGFDLGGELSARLGGLAVTMDNDVNAALFGEVKAGVARGCKEVVMLAMGTGVGGGLVFGGKLYRGAGGVAAELGHTTLQVDGPECSCGQPGHVEAYLGTKGIVVYAGGKMAEASEEGQQPLLEQCRQEGELTPRALGLAAAAGDPLSISILADVGRLLGLVCANLVNALNPEMVIIGGGVAGAGDLLLGPAREALKAKAMPPSREGVRLVAAELGTDAAAIGAAMLALDALEGEGEGA